jgi:hypothetical protein
MYTYMHACLHAFCVCKCVGAVLHIFCELDRNVCVFSFKDILKKIKIHHCICMFFFVQVEMIKINCLLA